MRLANQPPSRPEPAGEKGRYTLGGFTDATFTAMAVLELGETPTGPSSTSELRASGSRVGHEADFQPRAEVVPDDRWVRCGSFFRAQAGLRASMRVRDE